MKKYFYCLLCVFAVGIVSLAIYFAIPKNKPVDKLTVNASNYSMQVGDKKEFVVLTNKNANLFFTVEDSDIAALSSDSKYILALKVGKTSVKVVAKYETQTEEISVEVQVTAKEQDNKTQNVDDGKESPSEKDDDAGEDNKGSSSETGENTDDSTDQNSENTENEDSKQESMEKFPTIPGGDEPEEEKPEDVVDGSLYIIKFVDVENMRVEDEKIYLLGKEIYFTITAENFYLDAFRVSIDVEGEYLKNVFNNTYKLTCPDKSEFVMRVTFVIENKIVEKLYHVYNQSNLESV